jgi:hypothetical protein
VDRQHLVALNRPEQEIIPKMRVAASPPVLIVVWNVVPRSLVSACSRRLYPSPSICRLVATSMSCAVNCTTLPIGSPAFFRA